MTQLDGLRAIAAFLVMFEHWLPPQYHLRLPWATAGVHLFFVLSGFLITGILLRVRDDAELVAQPMRRTLLAFYVRRGLRIFPLYYLAVIVAAFTLNEGRRMLWPNLLYLSNFKQFHDQQWAGPVTHFWTLGVEEQFYLVWPFILLTLPRRWLGWAIVMGVWWAMMVRVSFSLGWPEVGWHRLLPISCLDSLGLGAMIALLRYQFGGSRRFEWLCLIVGAPIWMLARAVVLLKMHRSMPAIATLEFTGMALVFTWLIGRTSRGLAGWPGRALSWGPLVYLGTISYGLYVWHGLLPPLVRPWFQAILGNNATRPIIDVLLLTLLTVGLASASWWLYERPLNNLKRYWPYVWPYVAKRPADRVA